MEPSTLSPLPPWESFSVIVGSSAAALTGLQFVVIALGAEARTLGGGAELSAFGTPTIVHFCAALFISAIVSAPWQSLISPGVTLGAAGAGGLVYTVIVITRARQQKGYAPVLEDWIWHAILPPLAYAALLVAAVIFPWQPRPCLFTIAAASLLLLFIGILNAWDAVTYLAVKRPQRSSAPEPGPRQP